mmetsp:Transcript_64468/g.76355  ORF Transcript_64468/g.76355 Transcript_64468/m.76355 type:complete len:98 (+) Transcript_64468:268-561(+)
MKLTFSARFARQTRGRTQTLLPSAKLLPKETSISKHHSNSRVTTTMESAALKKKLYEYCITTSQDALKKDIFVEEKEQTVERSKLITAAASVRRRLS